MDGPIKAYDRLYNVSMCRWIRDRVLYRMVSIDRVAEEQTQKQRRLQDQRQKEFYQNIPSSLGSSKCVSRNAVNNCCLRDSRESSGAAVRKIVIRECFARKIHICRIKQVYMCLQTHKMLIAFLHNINCYNLIFFSVSEIFLVFGVNIWVNIGIF
ncbi:unnamed protein product [Pneumocystis jirovecii]|uniref:Uncharacterized protein n=1 Tax=Pneumocystis jirovecii TaxID=42068 RepID=L0P909_PNEJI|nr:unnamed protein product [Pneumocystis jirovecii]